MTLPSTLPTEPAEAERRFYARYAARDLTAWGDVQALLGRNRPRPVTVEDWVGLAEDVRERLAAPKILARVQPALIRPFELAQIEIKPGATTREKDRALALAYVDLRAYQDRLDEVVGLEGWSVTYRQLGKSLICHLTILGVVKEDVGEPSADGNHPATEALAQAFKRACCTFGLGRYLYSLPKLWFGYDERTKGFVDAPGAIREIYRQAGLLPANEARNAPMRASGGGR